MIYQFEELEDRHQWPLQILYLNEGYLQESLYRPSGNAYYQWIYCAAGEGTLVIKDRSYRVLPGVGMLLLSGEGYSLTQNTEDWTVHILSFTGTCTKEILLSLGFETSGVYALTDESFFSQCIASVKNCKTIKKREQSPALSSLCYDFLINLASHLSHVNQEHIVADNSMVIRVITYLESNYSKQITLEDVANHLHLSKEYLCAQFKRHTNTTIFSYLNKIRLGNAKVLFRQYPFDSVASIARRCGFDSPSYFGKLFLEETGVTPNTYRKLNN